MQEKEKNTARLEFLIRHGVAVNVDFHGNYFIVVTAYFWQQNNKDAFYDKAVSVKSVRMVA